MAAFCMLKRTLAPLLVVLGALLFLGASKHGHNPALEITASSISGETVTATVSSIRIGLDAGPREISVTAAARTFAITAVLMNVSL